MRFKPYKNIVLFGIAWVLFFFVTEFLMNIIFKDKTPFWKILAISFLSGFGMFYPFLKNSKNFSINMVKKKQKRAIKVEKGNVDTNLKEKIIEQLKLNKFKITNSDLEKIELKSKWNINSFGEKYVVSLNEDEITIESFPRLNIFPFDSGRCYEQTNLIEKEIINLC
jgi:hypothetical protein